MDALTAESQRLAPLETFDPKAFIGDHGCPQSVCDFVLALALVYNDLKDLDMALRMLEPHCPKDPLTPTPVLGQFSGVCVHIRRVEVGTIKELLNLITDNKDIIASKEFAEFSKKLSKRARDAWKSVLDVALQRPTADSLGKLLLFVRNKVAFHYDRKEVARGYADAFVKDATNRVPYISRGNSMVETRFYFAEAAAEKYFLNISDHDTALNFLTGHFSLFNDINLALFEIVTRFVNARGYGWRSVSCIT